MSCIVEIRLKFSTSLQAFLPMVRILLIGRILKVGLSVVIGFAIQMDDIQGRRDLFAVAFDEDLSINVN